VEVLSFVVVPFLAVRKGGLKILENRSGLMGRSL